MKITEALFAEHVVFHSVFDHVEKSAPPLRSLPEIRVLAGLLQAMLSAHSTAEDQLLIEPLEHCIDQLGHQETFHQEHQQIDTSLEQILRTESLEEAHRLLLATVRLAREHFDKEERIVFPLAEERLSPNTLAALGAMWESCQKGTCPPKTEARIALNRFVPTVTRSAAG